MTKLNININIKKVKKFWEKISFHKHFKKETFRHASASVTCIIYKLRNNLVHFLHHGSFKFHSIRSFDGELYLLFQICIIILSFAI